ncbi:13846_t:CDS:2 [Acaulospora morrowiae]|uniref:U3 small nucleolar RNA-associated protein 11 n=1 Tax=Acaulospora morrowiae TaxID=94023 RepID=A0A9N9CQB5_9GLOM|nr:13846_t:CDS:2 [Acaulospora morrowiae]
MSSLRNALQRRNHKERAQPRSREKHGLLEKHKDYVLRARDYHAKQETLKKMREKAYFKNPDEFYFKMINSATKGGVHVERNSAFSGDVIKMLKSQDLNYVKIQHDLGKKKIERLNNELHFIDNDIIQDPMSSDKEEDEEKHKSTKSRHIIFVETKEEAKKFDPAKHFDTLPELIGRKFNRPRIKTLENEIIPASGDEIILRKLHKQRLTKHKELRARLERQEQLKKVEQELQIQKNLTGKGRRKKIGVDKNGLSIYKWKNDRKK